MESEQPEPGRDSTDDDLTPEERAFIEGLLERGEAAEAVDGVLPPGATHEIVERRPGRLPKVRRRSFSLDGD
jgi:hypothetical protein